MDINRLGPDEQLQWRRWRVLKLIVPSSVQVVVFSVDPIRAAHPSSSSAHSPCQPAGVDRQNGLSPTALVALLLRVAVVVKLKSDMAPQFSILCFVRMT